MKKCVFVFGWLLFFSLLALDVVAQTTDTSVPLETDSALTPVPTEPTFIAPKNAPLPPKRPLILAPALTPYAKLYQALNVPTLWTDEGFLAPEVASLREALQASAQHGLPPVYWTESLEAMFHNWDPSLAERFEVEATKALVIYAADLANGRVNPESIGNEIKIKRKAVPFDRIAQALSNTSADLKTSLESLAPQWKEYRDLQGLMLRLSAIPAEQWKAIPKPKKTLKVGAKDPVFALVKERLALMGFPVTEKTPVYTKELQELVKRYYEEQSIAGTPSLAPSAALWAHLNVPLTSRVQQVRLNMEKLRWFPASPGQRFGSVNLALQKLRVFDQGSQIMEMRTINGKSQRKSPMLVDRVTVVELNPDWTIPPRLVVEDKGPAFYKDPDYFEKGNYVILDRRGRRLSPWQINWSRLTKAEASQYLRIKQSPGLGNALGIMKFHLTNPYAIYLHDTNERGLFAEHHRLLSSGCIRLERPLDLSTFLLQDHPKWSDPNLVLSNLSQDQVIEPWLPAKLQIKLVTPFPVYLMYLTVEGSETGLMRFANDYYGQDQRLFDVLQGKRIKFKAEELGE